MRLVFYLLRFKNSSIALRISADTGARVCFDMAFKALRSVSSSQIVVRFFMVCIHDTAYASVCQAVFLAVLERTFDLYFVIGCCPCRRGRYRPIRSVAKNLASKRL